jgi:hypothetical protein
MKPLIAFLINITLIIGFVITIPSFAQIETSSIQAVNNISTPIKAVCPTKTNFNYSLGVCEDKDSVYGNFTQAITTKCGKAKACTVTIDMPIDNSTIKLQRYSKSIYTKLRGNKQCPLGSLPYTKDAKLCAEKVLIDNTTKNDLLGPFDPFVITACNKLYSLKASCNSNRLPESIFELINKKIDTIGQALTQSRTFMYHGFEESLKRDNFMNVNIPDFKAQLNWLIDNNYTITTTQAVVDAVLNDTNALLLNKRAILQLDDGYHSILLADKAAGEVSIDRKVSVPLEIGLVQDNVGRSNKHLSLADYKALINHGHKVVSHTKSHCSLGDSSLLDINKGVAITKMPSFVECQFYTNTDILRPLSLDAHIKQLNSVSEYIGSEFGFYTPALIYPFGHSSNQNIAVMKSLGIVYGYNTVYQPICSKDLDLAWKDTSSNYSIPRITVSGHHIGVTDSQSWFKKAELVGCK